MRLTSPMEENTFLNGGGYDYRENIILTVLCAGREPIVGAMWFVYVLLFSLMGFSIISFICKKTTKSKNAYNGYRLLVFSLLQLFSCLLTNQFQITIPRCSNVFSTMLLIYIGQQINQTWKWKFDNGYIALACAILVYQGTLLMGNGSVGLNKNVYSDMMQLTIGSVAALYLLCYISKKIGNTAIGKCLCYLGTESFYIMCLHIVGFHLCTMALNYIGIMEGGGSAGMTPMLDYWWLLFIYFFFGISAPLVLIRSWRRMLKFV